MKPRLLVACEMSGRVRDAFAARGWNAWSADILECEAPSYMTVRNRDVAVTDMHATEHGNHYVGDVLGLFKWSHPVNEERHEESNYAADNNRPLLPLWDMIIAHPPCTDLSYAGAVWFKYKDARRGGDGRMQAAAGFFMEMLNSPSPLVAVENPHSIIQEDQWAGKPTQIVEPWWFGDPKKKQIHLWLKGLPKLVMDCPVSATARVTTGGGSNRTDRKNTGYTSVSDEDSEGRANRAKVRSRTSPALARAMADQWGNFAENYCEKR